MERKMTEPITCRVITGPTASGKTDLALRLAREAGLHILCMDSMQIYRRMDIGTAKPSQKDRQEVPHHLIDICEPYETFSAAEYRDTAEKTILHLHESGKEVLFVGGTVFYLQAMMHPMNMGLIPGNPAFREELNRLAITPEGRIRLHERLEKTDPETAARLHVNDTRRVIRAIEVTETTGVPFSRQPQREADTDGRFLWKAVSTAMDRSLLYQRINDRVDMMIRAGLYDEVARLLQEGVPEDAQSMSGLGYKEMIPCIQGKCSLDDAAERIRTGTRHYAKRQMTFLRREDNLQYINTDSSSAWDDLRRILL